MNGLMIPTYDDMLAAHDRIRPHIRQTPVRTSDSVSYTHLTLPTNREV